MKKKTYRTPKTRMIRIPVECILQVPVSGMRMTAPLDRSESEQQESDWIIENDLSIEVHK